MGHVCPNRDRLPSSLLIENASAPELPCAPASCSEPFPIKASDFTSKMSLVAWPTASSPATYGWRSSDALPLFTSKGTELCSCVTIHLSCILRKQIVARHHMSNFVPSAIVPFT